MESEQSHRIGGQGGRTRRQLVGGAAASGVAVAVGGQLLLTEPAHSATPLKPCIPDAPGIETGAIAATPDGRRIWSVDTRGRTVTEHSTKTLRRGRALDVGGTPVGLAISPRGGTALVTTAAYDHPGLAIIDLHTREIDRIDVGEDPRAIAFAPSGRTAYVAGGTAKGTLTPVVLGSRRVRGPIALGVDPRGVAVSPDGKVALVALNGEAKLALVDLERGRVIRRIATAAFPALVAFSPDGHRALVTHNGFGARAISVVDLERRAVVGRVRVGADPAGVAFSRSGRTAVVTAVGTATVTILDGRSGRRRRTVSHGGFPRAVTVSGTRALVVDARSGLLTAIKLGMNA